MNLPQIDVVGMIQSFWRESERVLLITHKPKDLEYRQIASITALGMLLIGFIGFIITMAAFFLRGGGV